MELVVRTAMQIFRSSIVTKNQLSGRFQTAPKAHLLSRRGRKTKRGEKGPNSTETERFAMSALESLLEGTALSVNCIVSAERLHLMWYLYRQLQSLMGGPQSHHFMGHMGHVGRIAPPPPTMQHDIPEGSIFISSPGSSTQRPASPHQFMHHPEIAAQYQQMQQPNPQHAHPSGATSAPHQFLFRDPQDQQMAWYEGDANPDGASEASRSQAPGAMPLHRNGQSMKLNFHRSPLVPPSESNAHMGPPPHVPRVILHPGTKPKPLPQGYSPSPGSTPGSGTGPRMAPNGAYLGMTGPAGRPMAPGPIVVGD